MAAEDDLRRLAAADPTPLTTAMLLREIANLSEKLTIRLDAMDKAMTLFQENLVRVPTEVQKEVGHLKILHEQRFEEGSRALAAALQAQKELASAQDTANATALTKAQDATDKQIDGIKAMVGAEFKSVGAQIGIINERLGGIHYGRAGAFEERKETRDHTSLIIAGLALLAAVGLHFLK